MKRYKRYHIEIKRVPHLYPVPHKFEPVINKFELLKMLVGEFFHYFLKGLKNKKLKIYLKTFLDRPCKYGVFYGRFGGFKPIKEKCTRCFECKIEYPKVVKDVIINPHYKALHKIGLNMEDIDTILYESETGKEKVSGMGYRGPFSGYGFDSIWLDMSEIVRPTRDGKEGREYISTETQIGRKVRRFGEGKSKTVTIQIPIIFDYQPFGNYELHHSIARASLRSGTLYIVSLELFEKFKNQYKCLVPLIKVNDYIKDFKTKILEFEIDKIEEIKRYDAIRSANPDSIIIGRIKAEDNFESLILSLLKKGADGIHLCANYDGRGFSKSGHIKDFLLSIHKKLTDYGIRSTISIIASGGINKAEHVPKAIGCGADVVAIDIPVHIALQSEFKEKGDEYDMIPKKIDIEWGMQRILNLLSAWHEQLIEALSAMGKRDSRRLTGDFGRLIFFEEMFKEAFSGIERKNEGN